MSRFESGEVRLRRRVVGTASFKLVKGQIRILVERARQQVP